MSRTVTFMTNPKVSVAIITCNHEAYIEQAVESVLMQETDFEYEILISEDCSADATQNILKALRDQWPGRIQLLLSEHNQANNDVLVRCFDAARGEYIALLQGDDYWTSPRKLQKQVEFMEAHPGCVTSFHAAELVYEPGVKEESPTAFQPKAISTLNDLLIHGCFIETPTVLFRRDALGTVPDWYRHREIFADDWILHILLAQHGDIGYMDEPLAAHRYHLGGIWTQLNTAERLEKTIAASTEIQKHLGTRGRPLKRVLANHWYCLAAERINHGQVAAAQDCAKYGIAQYPWSPKLLLLRYAPRFWRLLKSLTREI